MNTPDEPPKEAILVVNTLSRYGLLAVAPARTSLARHGIHVKRASAVRSSRRISEVVREAVQRGEKLVVD